MKRIIIGCVAALGLVLGGGGAAMAGEYNGHGGDVPGAHKASSACAFSGRDLPDDVEDNHGEPGDDFITGGHVQSYGQVVRAGFKDMAPSPGVACRGNAESPE